MNKKTMLVMLACFGYHLHLQSMTSTVSRSGQRVLREMSKRSANNGRKFSTAPISQEKALVPYQFNPESVAKDAPWYEVLNVSKNATQAEINAAYKKLITEFHPDINKNPNAREIATKINNAKNEGMGKKTIEFTPEQQNRQKAAQEKVKKDLEDLHKIIKDMEYAKKISEDLKKLEKSSIFEKIQIAPSIYNNLKKAMDTKNLTETMRVLAWKDFNSKNKELHWPNIQEALRKNNISESDINIIKPLFYSANAIKYGVPIATAGYATRNFSTIPFQDDLYNSHMDTIGLDDDIAENISIENLAQELTPQELEILTKVIDDVITEQEHSTPDDTNQNHDQAENNTSDNSTLDSKHSPENALESAMSDATSVDENSTDNHTQKYQSEDSSQPSTPESTPQPDVIPTPQPVSWWNSITSSAQYTLDSATTMTNNGVALASENPITTGVIVAGVAAALGTAGYYYYMKYYGNPSKDADEPEKNVDDPADQKTIEE